MKVVAAVPVEAFSFDEAERVIHDEQLSHDIAGMLRRHFQGKPVNIVVPTDAYRSLQDLDCKFYYGKNVKEDPIRMSESDRTARILSIINELSGITTPGSEALIDVVSFGPGVLMRNIPAMLTEKGLRPATATEAAGFLQARGKKFTNAGRKHGPHSFFVIGTDNAQLHFTTDDASHRARKWMVYAHKRDGLFANEVLVAKL